jgi:hypothetical protein
MKFCDHFRGIASAHVGRGDTTLLWQDVWNGHHLKSELPRIYSYARNRKISVALFCSTSDVHQHFHTPISSQAAQELITLYQIVSQAQVNNQGRDKWTYIWGSERYTPSKFYNLCFASIQVPQPFKWIWRTKVSKKIKFFIWLLFRDKINSRNLLKRKHFKIEGDDYSCVLYNLNIEELSYHLIFQCPFSSECWDYLDISWDHSLLFFDTIQKAKQEFSAFFFMEIFSIAAWEIWKQRNGKIFRGVVSSFTSKSNFFICIVRQMYRFNRDVRSALSQWLDTLP